MGQGTLSIISGSKYPQGGKAPYCKPYSWSKVAFEENVSRA